MTSAARWSAGGRTGWPGTPGPGAFQPGEYQRSGSAVQRLSQARGGEFGAEGRGAGLQVDAAEAGPVGPHQGEASAEFGQGRAGQAFQFG